ncbi:MAG TPA: GspH/FimT family pseudopilin [Rhodocyclaceae bacterium]|nr:GspH/FimT family pseudopilin [Rhodocyclaceae bacterium]
MLEEQEGADVLNRPIRAQTGFTLIELLITMVIMAILLSMGVRLYQDWIVRTKIRVSTESLVSGLATARNIALQRNQSVFFSMTSNLGATCALDNTAGNWVISLDTPETQCNIAPSEVTPPRIQQMRSGGEGGGGVTIDARNAANAAANQLLFTGLGRVQALGTNPIATINVSYSAGGGTCRADGGDIRCLRIQVSPGGEARICDPSVSVAGDPRTC